MICALLTIIALALIDTAAEGRRERRRERHATKRCEWCGRTPPTKFSSGYGMEEP